MRIGQTMIIPAILALGIAGSAVAASAIPVAAGQLGHVSRVHSEHKGDYVDPNLYYHI